MKRLYILRHAKSNLLEGIEDKERPLSEEGRHEARALGHKMAAMNYTPNFVLCSPALRTKHTYETIGSNWNVPESFEEKLYLASAGQLYEFIKSIDDQYGSALLVGHNPGIHELIRLLVNKANPAYAEKLSYGYRSGTLSVLDCNTEKWGQLTPDDSDLVDLLVGEELA